MIWKLLTIQKAFTSNAWIVHFIRHQILYQRNWHFSFSQGSLDNPSVFEGLEKLDVIFIESIEQLPSVKEWELALFNLINACLLSESRILISSKVTAKALEIKLPDLKSRLLAFPAFELPEITEEEKFMAMKEAAERKGLMFEDNVLSYILTHTSRKLSDLLSLLNELDNYSLERKRKVSISLVKDLMSNKVDNPGIWGKCLLDR